MLDCPHQTRPDQPTRHVARTVIVITLVILACATRARSAASASTRPANGSMLVSEGLENGRMVLLTGKSALIATNRPYKRLSTADPDVASIRAVGTTSILITPKKAGLTQLILWDDDERSQVIDVAVQADVHILSGQLKSLFPDARIEVTSAKDSIVLHGRVPSAAIAERAVTLASPYGKVLNLLEVAGGRQVMLQVRFAEVSRAATSALGVNFGYTDGRSFAASNIGQVNPLTIKEFRSELTGLASAAPSPSVTLFGRAAVGDVALDYFLTALRQNNLLRILAEPNLVAISGKEASFLAGGEFPIPVTQGAGTALSNAAITVEYREFGVRLKFLPVVLGEGRIRLEVSPEVSDLDFTTAVRFSGFVVPGLTTRKLSTTIELNEGQTFAIAGLLSSSVSASKDVTPLLGDVPVLGALFRSVRYQRRETELVVLVTPRLAEGTSRVGEAPGENWRHPSEAELFLNADIGGPAPKTGKTKSGPEIEPRRFFGPHGFIPASQPSSAASG